MEPFSRPCVEFRGDPIAVVLCQVRHGLFLGQVLTNEPVGVFVGPAFPRMVRCREVAAGAGRVLDRGVAMELGAVVGGDRPDYAVLVSNQLGCTAVHFRRRACPQFADRYVAGRSLDQRQNAGSCLASPEHRVDFPVADLSPGFHHGWSRRNGPFVGHTPAAS